jgi:hypothetical protein
MYRSSNSLFRWFCGRWSSVLKMSGGSKLYESQHHRFHLFLKTTTTLTTTIIPKGNDQRS